MNRPQKALWAKWVVLSSLFPCNNMMKFQYLNR